MATELPVSSLGLLASSSEKKDYMYCVASPLTIEVHRIWDFMFSIIPAS